MKINEKDSMGFRFDSGSDLLSVSVNVETNEYELATEEYDGSNKQEVHSNKIDMKYFISVCKMLKYANEELTNLKYNNGDYMFVFNDKSNLEYKDVKTGDIVTYEECVEREIKQKHDKIKKLENEIVELKRN